MAEFKVKPLLCRYEATDEAKVAHRVRYRTSSAIITQLLIPQIDVRAPYLGLSGLPLLGPLFACYP